MRRLLYCYFYFIATSWYAKRQTGWGTVYSLNRREWLQDSRSARLSSCLPQFETFHWNVRWIFWRGYGIFNKIGKTDIFVNNSGFISWVIKMRNTTQPRRGWTWITQDYILSQKKQNITQPRRGWIMLSDRISEYYYRWFHLLSMQAHWHKNKEGVGFNLNIIPYKALQPDIWEYTHRTLHSNSDQETNNDLSKNIWSIYIDKLLHTHRNQYTLRI